MIRTMTYPNATSHNNDLTYSQKSMTGTGKLDAGELLLAFDVPEGNDYISFIIPQAALTSGFKGTYELLDRQRSPSKIVDTRYVYTLRNIPGTYSSTIYQSNTNTMQGQVTITSYDAQRHLLSGSYVMAIENLDDPTYHRPFSNTEMRCNLKVEGTFTNLKLK